MSIKNGNNRQNLLWHAGKSLFATFVILSVLIAQCGVELKHHFCSESGHEHVDIDLIAGVDALLLCFDEEDDCCSGHTEENECGDCCSDTESVVVADFASLVHGKSIHVQTPQSITLFATALDFHTTSVVSDINHSSIFADHENTAQTHSRLCALLCTMLC